MCARKLAMNMVILDAGFPPVDNNLDLVVLTLQSLISTVQYTLVLHSQCVMPNGVIYPLYSL